MLFMARRRVFSALTFGSKAGCVFGGGANIQIFSCTPFSFFYLSPSNLVTPILSHTQLLSLFLSIFQTLIHTNTFSHTMYLSHSHIRHLSPSQMYTQTLIHSMSISSFYINHVSCDIHIISLSLSSLFSHCIPHASYLGTH